MAVRPARAFERVRERGSGDHLLLFFARPPWSSAGSLSNTHGSGQRASPKGTQSFKTHRLSFHGGWSGKRTSSHFLSSWTSTFWEDQVSSQYKVSPFIFFAIPQLILAPCAASVLAASHRAPLSWLQAAGSGAWPGC